MQYKRRRSVIIAISLLAVVSGFIFQAIETRQQAGNTLGVSQQAGDGSALAALDTLPVKGRAPETGYDRALFGGDWLVENGCSMRERILQRDLTDMKLDEDGCKVLSGTLQDPYSGKTISFMRGQSTSQAVQIDHVVAVSDAWQKGAQELSPEQREAFYNDPLNLLAVDGPTNQDKGDGDAATWLPPNKDYRCRYVAIQIAVKQKYGLWITAAEKRALENTLSSCIV